jgi:hypothetical protein
LQRDNLQATPRKGQQTLDFAFILKANEGEREREGASAQRYFVGGIEKAEWRIIESGDCDTYWQHPQSTLSQYSKWAWISKAMGALCSSKLYILKK